MFNLINGFFSNSPICRNDPDALVEIEPEMDLEIQLAFKDFVSFQNRK